MVFGPSNQGTSMLLVPYNSHVPFVFEFGIVQLPTPDSAFEYNYVLAHEYDLVYEKPEGSLLFKNTLPHAKLYYPEPFIASPSYMRSNTIYNVIFYAWLLIINSWLLYLLDFLKIKYIFVRNLQFIKNSNFEILIKTKKILRKI
jgi:hypothetical protein